MTDSDAGPGGLYARVVRALGAAGIDAALDVDLETFAVEHDGRSTVGVVMPHFDVVAVHSVWPEPVPAPALERLTEAVTRLNTKLYTANLELDLDQRVLSARTSISCAPLATLDDATFGGVLRRAMEDVATTAAASHDQLAAALTSD